MVMILLIVILGAIEKLIMMDTSYDMLKSCQATKYDDSIETSYIVGDEEFLPIKERFA